MLIPGDWIEIPTRAGLQWRQCISKAWLDNGLWHVLHSGGEFIGTYLPPCDTYNRYCWTRNKRDYE